MTFPAKFTIMWLLVKIPPPDKRRGSRRGNWNWCWLWWGRSSWPPWSSWSCCPRVQLTSKIWNGFEIFVNKNHNMVGVQYMARMVVLGLLSSSYWRAIFMMDWPNAYLWWNLNFGGLWIRYMKNYDLLQQDFRWILANIVKKDVSTWIEEDS